MKKKGKSTPAGELSKLRWGKPDARSREKAPGRPVKRVSCPKCGATVTATEARRGHEGCGEP